MPDSELSVSVIIPVFNGEAFLGEAVESIRRQRPEPLEIIVIDDGSTDGTKDVAAGFGSNVRYVYQPNAGPPAARNAGLRLARGSVIGFLDADDIWTGDKLSLQVPMLAGNPRADVVAGYTKVVPLRERDAPGPEAGELMSPGFVLALGPALFRRSSFDRFGGFDERLRYDDDVDWFLRAKERGLQMLIHKHVVQLYRRHSGNLTNQRDLDTRSFIAVLRKSLDRRRDGSDGKIRPLPRWIDPEGK